jgi:hypothetical protein
MLESNLQMQISLSLRLRVQYYGLQMDELSVGFSVDARSLSFQDDKSIPCTEFKERVEEAMYTTLNRAALLDRAAI